MFLRYIKIFIFHVKTSEFIYSGQSKFFEQLITEIIKIFHQKEHVTL